MTEPSTPSADEVSLVGLGVPFLAPSPASPRTRTNPPSGPGIRERCLPFTAAAATGLVVPAPFGWGWSDPDDVPEGGRSFRSPVTGAATRADRVFYVLDDVESRFEGNQFHPGQAALRLTGDAPIPGLSFFDRPDQQDMVKVHLPYVWVTEPGIDVLFLDPINRFRTDGLRVLAGLVETAWYTNPVNLVLRLPVDRPVADGSVHVEAGEALAQAVPIDSARRRPEVRVPAGHRRKARDVLKGVAGWRAAKARDRAAYQHAARSGHGRIEAGGERAG